MQLLSVYGVVSQSSVSVNGMGPVLLLSADFLTVNKIVGILRVVIHHVLRQITSSYGGFLSSALIIILLEAHCH